MLPRTTRTIPRLPPWSSVGWGVGEQLYDVLFPATSARLLRLPPPIVLGPPLWAQLGAPFEKKTHSEEETARYTRRTLAGLRPLLLLSLPLRPSQLLITAELRTHVALLARFVAWRLFLVQGMTAIVRQLELEEQKTERLLRLLELSPAQFLPTTIGHPFRALLLTAALHPRNPVMGGVLLLDPLVRLLQPFLVGCASLTTTPVRDAALPSIFRRLGLTLVLLPILGRPKQIGHPDLPLRTPLLRQRLGTLPHPVALRPKRRRQVCHRGKRNRRRKR